MVGVSYDLESPGLAFGRVAIIGDAAFVARPHRGAGVTKAALLPQAWDSIKAGMDDVGTALARFERQQRRFDSVINSHNARRDNVKRLVAERSRRAAG